MVASDRWDATDTWCEVLTMAAADLPLVSELAHERVAAVERACSRKSCESELNALIPGEPQQISTILAAVVASGLRATEISGGLVRSVASSPDTGDDESADPGPAILLDRNQGTLLLRPGVQLDLGEIVWAWAADWIAESCRTELGIGCLVNLGGDIAVRGEQPAGGWRIQIADGQPSSSGDANITMSWPGGLASTTNVSRPSQPHAEPSQWRTVTVAAHSCERAKAASLAALALGDSAPRWLTQRELPARLVHTAGVTIQTPGWPA
jgi:FAD:protein FMN transferase